jgi:hypothetical protein
MGTIADKQELPKLHNSPIQTASRIVFYSDRAPSRSRKKISSREASASTSTSAVTASDQDQEGQENNCIL